MPDAPIAAPDPLHEYRITKLEQVVMELSATLGAMLTEVQRAKWVAGGAFLFSQHKDIASFLNYLIN